MFAQLINEKLTSDSCMKSGDVSAKGDFTISNKAIFTSTPLKKVENSISTKSFGSVTKSLPNTSTGAKQKLFDGHKNFREEADFEKLEKEKKSKTVTFIKNVDSNALRNITSSVINKNFSSSKQQLIAKEGTHVLPPKTVETTILKSALKKEINHQDTQFRSVPLQTHILCFNNFKNASLASLQFTEEPLLDVNKMSSVSTPFVLTETFEQLQPMNNDVVQNNMVPFFHFMYHKNLPFVTNYTNKLEMKIRECNKKFVESEPLKVQMKMKKKSKYKMLKSKLHILPPLIITKINQGVQTEPTVTLSRVEYYTLPLLEELDDYRNKQGRYVVPKFTIGRAGYGNIYFPDEIDLTDLNLDEIVQISHKQIVVYPDKTKKPPFGQGLNRPAQITLNKIWPLDKNESPIKNGDSVLTTNFTNELKNICNSQGAIFESYEPVSGTWIFKVKHT